MAIRVGQALVSFMTPFGLLHALSGVRRIKGFTYAA